MNLLSRLRAYWPEIALMAVIGLLLALAAKYLAIDPFGEFFHLQSAKETLTAGHALIPQLNGQPYLLRDPLWTWLLLPGFKILGPHLLLARLPAVILGLIDLALVYTLAMILFRSRLTALLSTAVLGSTWAFLAWAPLSTADALVTTLTLAIACGFVYRQMMTGGVFSVRAFQSQDCPVALLLGLGTGLLLLAKGPLAVLLLAWIAFCYALCSGTLPQLVRFPWGAFLLAFLVTAIPWPLGVSLQPGQTDFWRDYGWTQPWNRLAGEGAWQSLKPDYGGFLGRFALMLFPYQPLLLALVLDRPFYRANTPPVNGLLLFLALWATSGVLVYTLSVFKEPASLLPFLAPLALLGGFYLARMAQSPLGSAIYNRLAGFYIVGWMALAVVMTVFIFYVLPDTYRFGPWPFPGQAMLEGIRLGSHDFVILAGFTIWKLWLLAVPLVLIVGGALLYGLLRFRRPQWAGGLVVAVSLVLCLSLSLVYLPIFFRPTAQGLASGLATVPLQALHGQVLIASAQPDAKRALFYLPAALRARSVFSPGGAALRAALNPMHSDRHQPVYGITDERTYYRLSDAVRARLRIRATAWSWDLWRFGEWQRLLRFQFPVFEPMVSRFVVFETLPPDGNGSPARR